MYGSRASIDRHSCQSRLLPVVFVLSPVVDPSAQCSGRYPEESEGPPAREIVQPRIPRRSRIGIRSAIRSAADAPGRSRQPRGITAQAQPFLGPVDQESVLPIIDMHPSKYPPAKPVALTCEPLKAAG